MTHGYGRHLVSYGFQQMRTRERSGGLSLQMGGDCRWLRWAVELQDTMDALFWDEKGGEEQAHRVVCLIPIAALALLLAAACW